MCCCQSSKELKLDDLENKLAEMQQKIENSEAEIKKLSAENSNLRQKLEQLEVGSLDQETVSNLQNLRDQPELPDDNTISLWYDY